MCVMEVEEGLDTGAVYRREEVAIGADTTADELRVELVAIGTRLVLDALANGLGEPEPQVGEPVYAHKIDPAELELDWAAPAIDVASRRACRRRVDDPSRPPVEGLAHGPATDR